MFKIGEIIYLKSEKEAIIEETLDDNGNKKYIVAIEGELERLMVNEEDCISLDKMKAMKLKKAMGN